MDRIDFRSDTVSWPTPEMREAMARARLGDDVYGEDPTVNALERAAAIRVGKSAGLFVASGTMGNLVAILTHAGRGDEAIVGYEAHTFVWEGGGMASLGGVTPHPLPTDADGRMVPAAVEAAVREEDDDHLPRSRLLLLENTFGGRGGFPLPASYFAEMRGIADRHGLAVHLDGARLFNAAVALGVDATELARDVDSVTFCLSKGLCAPVGSVLCGRDGFVREARRVRKMLGGGMRQAGVLAAAGLLALDGVERLADDHRHARRLADGLAAVNGVLIDAERTRTNIVHFRLDPGAGVDREQFIARMRDEHEIAVGSYPPDLLRAVTHYWVGPAEVDAFVEGTRSVLG